MSDFGLVGKNIDYSFSRSYFKNKFIKEQIDFVYVNFDIDSITEFPNLIKDNSGLKGMNVTIPYKQDVIPYLDKLDKRAQQIGAVNTIKITKNKKLVGYNTDYYGFKKALEPLLNHKNLRALILGTGGASKAVTFALKKLDIPYKLVSRQTNHKEYLSYNDLTKRTIDLHKIIINCTPLGTFPKIEMFPDIPYNAVTPSHILFDLIYNPSETVFLAKGRKQGATISNGLKMLELQAEKSWEIWNSKSK